jgi:hypothetical protein
MTKFSILKLSLIAAVFTLASTLSTLNAQSPYDLAQFKVPFAFEIGSVHFASGTYNIGKLNQVTLAVRGYGGGAFASMKPDSNGETIASNKLIFRRIGNQYFLREVWTAGSDDHLVAYESKAEKQALETALAANHSPSTGEETAVAQNGR